MSGLIDWIWSLDLDPYSRLTALALGRRANNSTFECYPSHKRLAAETRLSVSTVRRAINTLVEMKALQVEPRTRDDRTGQTSNLYRLMYRATFHRPDGTGHYEGVVLSGQGGMSPEDSHRTSKQGTKVLQKASPSSVPRAKPTFEKPSGVEDQVWADFLEVRRAKRAPLTKTAYNRLIAKLAKLASNDAERNEIFAQSVESGWQGIFPLKVEGEGRRNGAGSNPDRNRGDGFDHIENAYLRVGLRTEAARRTASNGAGRDGGNGADAGAGTGSGSEAGNLAF